MIYVIQWDNKELWSGAFLSLGEAQQELVSMGFKKKDDFLYVMKKSYAKIVPLKIKQ